MENRGFIYPAGNKKWNCIGQFVKKQTLELFKSTNFFVNPINVK